MRDITLWRISKLGLGYVYLLISHPGVLYLLEIYKLLKKMPLINVETDSQFQAELTNAGSKLVVVDFFAVW